MVMPCYWSWQVEVKIVFLTNQPSYYQVHFARAMAAELGHDNFRIVFEKQLSDDRIEMGWADDNTEPYILRFSHSAEQRETSLKWINDADVVIQGRFPIQYVRQRIRQGKLTFACQERLWKKSPSLLRILSRLPHLIKNYYSVNKPNYHFLAIGRYAAQDLNQLGIFKNRSWRFGYFIDCPEQIQKKQSTHLKLLWCGRFTEFKQPSKAILILEGLKQRGFNAHLTMIGDGDLKREIESQVNKLELSAEVVFKGWQSQDQIYQAMQESSLFMMTSHKGEGWGLVVNEAMSHGCAVMANRQLGSAECLIQHTANGLLYNDDDLNILLDEMSELGLTKIIDLGKRAHQTMSNEWSSTVAAKRLIALSTELIEGNELQAKGLYDQGIASPV